MAVILKSLCVGWRNEIGRFQKCRMQSTVERFNRIKEISVGSNYEIKRERILEGKQGHNNGWRVIEQEKILPRDSLDLSSQRDILSKLNAHTIRHLLPSGYPSSVHSSYASYASYSFMASTVSTATMVLSTQSLLLAVGVGQEAAAPISATLNWIIKDGIGQFGGILFASKVSSSTNSVDKDPKKWRMVSAIGMDIAVFMELMTPLFPSHFLMIASVANIWKNISFLTASASRAKLHQCLATQSKQSIQASDNLGDLTAKATSQSILASILGTCMGIGFSPYLLQDTLSLFSGCILLSGVNQLCTYQSLVKVPLRTFNRQRLMILLDSYFCNTKRDNRDDNISPEHISKKEHFLPFSLNECFQWLHIGCKLEKVCPKGPREFSLLHNDKEKFVLNFERYNDSKYDVYITYYEDADDNDILRGLYQCFAIKHILDGSKDESNSYTDLMTESYTHLSHFDNFKQDIINAGWIIDDNNSINVESKYSTRLQVDRNRSKQKLENRTH